MRERLSHPIGCSDPESGGTVPTPSSCPGPQTDQGGSDSRVSPGAPGRSVWDGVHLACLLQLTSTPAHTPEAHLSASRSTHLPGPSDPGGHHLPPNRTSPVQPKAAGRRRTQGRLPSLTLTLSCPQIKSFLPLPLRGHKDAASPCPRPEGRPHPSLGFLSPRTRLAGWGADLLCLHSYRPGEGGQAGPTQGTAAPPTVRTP